MGGFLVDLAVAGFLGYSIWRGYKRGLIRAVAKIFGLIVAVVAAAVLHEPFGGVAGALGIPERYEDLAGAVLVFILVLVAFRFAGDALAKTFRTTKIGRLTDGGGGAALSGLWALSLTSLVLLGISLFDGSGPAEAVEESSLGSSIVETAPEVVDAALNADLRSWLFDILRPDAGEEQGN